MIAWVLLTTLGIQGDPGPDVRALVEKLRSDDPAEREDATRKLREVGERAVPELGKAARDPDAEAAGRARTLLRVIAIRTKLPANVLTTRPDFDEQMAKLEPFSWVRVFDHVTALGPYLAGFGEPLGADQLEPIARSALAEADAGDVPWAARVWGIRGVVPELKRRLGRPDRNAQVPYALATFGAEEGVRALEELLAGGDAFAGWCLARLGRKDVAPKLARLVPSDDPEGYLAALAALVELRALEAAPAGTKLLDRDPGAAMVALGNAGARDSVPELLRRLESPAADLRRAAADALGKLGAGQAAPSLAALLKDEDSMVLAAAGAALARLRARDRAPGIAALLKHPDRNVRHNAAVVLGLLRAGDVVPDVMRVMNEPEAGARSAAIHALVELGAADRAGDLEPLLKDASLEVRFHAAWGLRVLAGRNVTRELTKLLGAADANVRRSAAMELGDAGAKEAVPALLKLLKDRDARDGAAESLCKLGSRDGVATLLALARSDLIWRELDALNALREPQLWRRMDAARPERNLEGTRREVLETVAKEVGATVELPEIWSFAALRLWWEGACYPSGLPWTLLEVFRDALPLGFHMVLDPGRIRLLPSKDAKDFWQGWWDAQQKK